ncbi:MAG: hypothetical protein LBK07_06965 [Tannerella sp.]|jgi:hypothetical protein|nr:hypothetical protein [Tannerella sp.]
MTQKNVFNQFQKFLKETDGDFHILEQRVPVETQMEYFKYSDHLRKKALSPEESDYGLLAVDLRNPLSSLEEKKHALSMLAISKDVRAYRLLEQYVCNVEPEIADWARMALIDSRITLESELSDGKQIYISTGLGGRGNKFRFFVLMLSAEGEPFAEYQKQIIEKEFAFSIPRYDCEIERLTVRERHVEMLFLAPMQLNIKMVIDSVMDECNQYGGFLANVYTVTNVKELDEEEIANIMKENGNRQTGN